MQVCGVGLMWGWEDTLERLEGWRRLDILAFLVSAQGLKAQAHQFLSLDIESFRAGYPADLPGSFVRTPRVKNFGQALETLEKQAFGCRDP